MSQAENDLRVIRAICERIVHANPGDTAVDLVRRMHWLAHPESAGRVWFDRWQVAAQMNTRLREVLADLLTRIDRGEPVPDVVTAEAWAVLGDVQSLMPEPSPDDPVEDPPR